MSKKIIVIIAVVLFVLIVAIIFLKISKPTAEVQNNVKINYSAATLPSNTNVNTYTGKIPTESIGSESQPDYINKAVSDFNAKTLSGKAVAFGYQQTVLVDENNKVISLDEFKSAQSININRNLEGFLKQDDFQIANCNSGKSKSAALILNVRLFSNEPNLPEEIAKAMKEWEPYMLNDLHNYFYPGADFSEKQLNEVLSFKQGKYRYAEVVLPDGEKSSINYGAVFDSIIISDSLNCLEKIYDSAETGEP